MNFSIIISSQSSTNYYSVAPISMFFSLIGVIISLFILILIAITKVLHTSIHLLTCNTCLSSILYCIVQCNNYIYLFFISWNTNDQSCRWRAYFGYMSIVAIIYSYLLQSISRFIFVFLSIKYRWLTSLKTHIYLIIFKWIIVLIIPLPSLLTQDIYFRSGFLCWVPKTMLLHIIYTFIAYYFLSILLIIIIYISIYIRIHYYVNHPLAQNNRRKYRDLDVLRNIMILFSIYIFGAIPSILYILTDIELFYPIGIVSVSFTVTIEKFSSILIDRDIRNTFKKYFCCRFQTQIAPMQINVNH